jgi:hypothetical protein
MSTKTKLFSASLILAASLMTAGIAQAQLAENDPEIGGQVNQCWGQIASQLAKDDMGAHSRSTKAADKVGGFASSENEFGITFNVKEDGGNAGRDGVGNVSKGKNSPHTVHPGDGGNGFHAITNASLADIIDPTTGQLHENPGDPLNSDLGCDLD